jgi:hypothetical protein
MRLCISQPFVRAGLCITALGLALACGGGGGGGNTNNPPAPVVSVSISPPSGAVNTGASIPFTATVTGSSNTAVTWTVTGAAGGTVSGSGLYTAPMALASASATATVEARSAADTSKAATAVVTVNRVVAVSISPSVTPSIGASTTFQFSAQVSGATDTSVTWAVEGGAPNGTITQAGLYTAPAAAGTYTVRATSLADPAATSTRTINVAVGGTVSLWQTGLPPNAFAAIQVAGPNGWTGTASSANSTFNFVPYGQIAFTVPTVTVSGTTYEAREPGASFNLTLAQGVGLQQTVAFAPVLTAPPGSIAAAGTAASNHIQPSAHRLASGRILLVAGVTTVCEEYDPTLQTFATVGSNLENRGFSVRSVLLADGKVLVAGGGYPDGLASTEIYDPGPKTWTLSGPMLTPRKDQMLVRLQDGKVLASGGRTLLNGTHLASAEIFNPATGTWSATGSMGTARIDHAAVLLADGRVLVVGGGDSSASRKSAEVFNPATGLWTAIASPLAEERTLPSLLLLPNGDVLVLGGQLAIERFNTAAQTFSTPASFRLRHQYAPAVLLPSGKAMIAGGQGNGDATQAMEIFDPTDNSVQFGPNLLQTRQEHVVVVGANGKAYFFGGRRLGNVALKTVEAYTP